MSGYSEEQKYEPSETLVMLGETDRFTNSRDDLIATAVSLAVCAEVQYRGELPPNVDFALASVAKGVSKLIKDNSSVNRMQLWDTLNHGTKYNGLIIRDN